MKCWDVEEHAVPALDGSTENGNCEQIFSELSYRNSVGRYVIPLPFKYPNPHIILKGSKCIAQKRFLNMERKLL